jgi:succinyl-CoA synthetase beta subunit
MLGNTLVTIQTGEAGKQVNRLYITDGVDIGKEYYLAMLVDRATSRIAMIASTEGGMDIEDVAHDTPEKIHTITIDPATGLHAAPWPRVAKALKPVGRSRQAGAEDGSSSFMTPSSALDAERMIEINPLAEPDGDKLLVLDAKMSFDSNALFRHKIWRTARRDRGRPGRNRSQRI